MRLSRRLHTLARGVSAYYLSNEGGGVLLLSGSYLAYLFAMSDPPLFARWCVSVLYLCSSSVWSQWRACLFPLLFRWGFYSKWVSSLSFLGFDASFRAPALCFCNISAYRCRSFGMCDIILRICVYVTMRPFFISPIVALAFRLVRFLVRSMSDLMLRC